MLIVGLASDAQSWQPIVQDLSRRYLPILPDIEEWVERYLKIFR